MSSANEGNGGRVMTGLMRMRRRAIRVIASDAVVAGADVVAKVVAVGELAAAPETLEWSVRARLRGMGRWAVVRAAAIAMRIDARHAVPSRVQHIFVFVKAQCAGSDSKLSGQF